MFTQLFYTTQVLAFLCVHYCAYETEALEQTMKICLNGADLHLLKSSLPALSRVIELKANESQALACSAITEFNDKGISSGRGGKMEIRSGRGGAWGRRSFDKGWR